MHLQALESDLGVKQAPWEAVLARVEPTLVAHHHQYCLLLDHFYESSLQRHLKLFFSALSSFYLAKEHHLNCIVPEESDRQLYLNPDYCYEAIQQTPSEAAPFLKVAKYHEGMSLPKYLPKLEL